MNKLLLMTANIWTNNDKHMDRKRIYTCLSAFVTPQFHFTHPGMAHKQVIRK